MTSRTDTDDRQEVRWHAWGDDAFRLAREQGKLILLDVGATWCHWCHVMDRETYEDDEVSRLLNERFIPVRVDRDRLPDVDAHYQRAAPLAGGGGNGWPLTVVLAPDGDVLFRATYLPPRRSERAGGMPGLLEILPRLDDYWQQHAGEVRQAGEQMREALAEAEAPAAPGEVTDERIETVAAGIRDAYDAEHGGFGTAPKFFSVAALELLSRLAWKGDDSARDMLTHTLERMAAGGVFDQLAGGFHRYSVDARWHVPHFEKMADDNAALLKLYADAYALTGAETLAEAARRTLDWIVSTLTAPGGRGFYASMDADVGPDDDGDYFTWTADAFRDAVGDGKMADVAASYYGVDDIGDMHSRPGRNVLRAARDVEQTARALDAEPAEVARLVERARERLLDARARREAPGVDTVLLADVNGMMIDAHLTAWCRLGDPAAGERALAALDAAREALRDDRGVFAHVREGGRLLRVGLLSDQGWMLRALLGGYAVSGEPRYQHDARSVADYVLEELTDDAGRLLSGPPLDTDPPAGVRPTSRWEDAPGRNPASVAAEALLELGRLTGEQRYGEAAAAVLRGLPDELRREHGLFYSGWGVAAETLLHGPRTVTVVGPADDASTARLTEAARRAYVPGPPALQLDAKLPAHTEQLRRMQVDPPPEAPAALVCGRDACLPPATTEEQLSDRLTRLASL
jgi:hypothetical protein